MFFESLALIPIAIIGLIVLAIVALGERREADPTGRRPLAIYLLIVMFVTMFVALFSATGLVSALTNIALPDRGFIAVGASPPVIEPVPPTFGDDISSPPGLIEYREPDPDREHIINAVETGFVAAAAVLVFLFHWRRLRELEAEGSLLDVPVRRSYQVYLYAVCFVAVLIALGAGAAAAVAIVRIASPGTFAFGDISPERDEGIEQLASSGFVALVALAIFAYHWARAGRLRKISAPPPAAPPPAATEPPPA